MHQSIINHSARSYLSGKSSAYRKVEKTYTSNNSFLPLIDDYIAATISDAHSTAKRLRFLAMDNNRRKVVDSSPRAKNAIKRSENRGRPNPRKFKQERSAVQSFADRVLGVQQNRDGSTQRLLPH